MIFQIWDINRKKGDVNQIENLILQNFTISFKD